MSEVENQDCTGSLEAGDRALHTAGPIIPERFDAAHRVPHTGINNDGRFVYGKIIKSVVFPESAQLQPPIMILSDATHLEVASSEQYRNFFGAVTDLGFYFVTDLRVWGRNILMKDGRYLYAEDIMPAYVEQEIKQGIRTEAYASDSRVARPFSGTTVLLGSEGYPIFGHWLVDILPRAWLYKECFGEQSEDVRYLFGSDLPAFGRNMLAELFDIDPDKIDVYDISFDEPILERAIIPSMPHNSHVFHPALKRAVAYILEKAHSCAFPSLLPTTATRKIYISRSRFRGISISSPREISNEAQLETIAREAGFEVVYPEELSFFEQIRLFSEACIVVGESGSGLHNTIFSSPGTVILCLRPATQVQGTLAAALDQILYFLCPSNTTSDAGTVRFEIDPIRFNRALYECIACFEASTIGSRD